LDTHFGIMIKNKTNAKKDGVFMVYGYVRVSSKEQNVDRQVIAMLEFGVPRERIIIEKQSGKDFNRPKYKGLTRKIKPDDVIVIKSIDRLGRNYNEIIEQWRYISKVKKAAFVVFDMPLLDTRKRRDLMSTLIDDIVLQLLSYVAQTEREMIHQRQAEGIEAAKKRGVKFGRPRKPKPEHYGEILNQWNDKKITAAQAAAALNIDRKTFLRWAGVEK